MILQGDGCECMTSQALNHVTTITAVYYKTSDEELEAGKYLLASGVGLSIRDYNYRYTNYLNLISELLRQIVDLSFYQFALFAENDFSQPKRKANF